MTTLRYRGPFWTPITPETGSLFHAETQAEDAIGITREMGEAQTRAYLSVISGKAIFKGGIDPELILRIRNAGNSPAFDVTADFHRSTGVVFDEKPTGDISGMSVAKVRIAKLIGAGSEDDFSLGVVSSPPKAKDEGGLGFVLEGILEYQTVFDVKTGNIDMDTPFLFMFGPSRPVVETAVREGKILTVEMKRFPAFMSGWIVDYRRIVRSARDKERREKQEKQT
ncbi:MULTISPECIES: hypothetical protein [unclassified Mesorhizobium]|uniref:hypothetical protein n=1 Tax=unclassified Mesorhizobium TaxID=325217 RepID=UPI0012EBD767|nr:MULTISPECIES: hypothetical protein [unclassified Mesorhizobium]WJI74826.1 hypothetical protein NLY37_28540 [Mesorhizobium sp. C395A]